MDLVSAVQLATHTAGVGAQTLLMMAVASVMLYVEVPRRFGDSGPAIVSPRAIAKNCTKVVSRCWPESGGLLLVVIAAISLRFLAPLALPMTLNGRAGTVDPLDEETWREIVNEWPVLLGADTLLGFQAMLRLFVLVVATLRTLCFQYSKGSDKVPSPGSPFSGMASALALSGMLARVALTTQDKNYWLEGPLGFEVPIACEMAMVPLLSTLAFAAVRRTSVLGSVSSVVGVAAIVSAATVWASQHYLNLAENPSIDRLYTLAHTLEVLSAVAFFYSSVRMFFAPKGEGLMSSSMVFLYIMMPLQQCLAAYFYLTSTPPEAMPLAVGAGRPWCVLIVGSLVALGAYLCAAAMALASYLIRVDSEEVDSSAESRKSTTVHLQLSLATTGLGDPDDPEDPEKAAVCGKAIYL